jgi:hypothetical protein
MIRASKHTLSESNTGKLSLYGQFLAEMRRVAVIYVDYLWTNQFQWSDKNDVVHTMDIANKQYDVPPFFDYNLIPVETDLCARALSSLITQCCGMVKANVEKQRRRLYLLESKRAKNEPISAKLLENIAKFEPVKPNPSNINLEISSKCADFSAESNHFDGFIRLSSIGERYGHIKLPIQFHRQSNKWMKKGWMLGSFLFCDDVVEIRWESVTPPKKTVGREVGGDSGIKDVLVLSDKQVTPKMDVCGNTMDSIVDKLSRRKKGSKNFAQTQAQRKNFINYSINQLNFDDIKKVKLEKIGFFGYKTRISRRSRHWMATLTRDKIFRICEELGVQVSEQSSTYRSQRCSGCGMVLKKNRHGKEYFCSNCGLVIDADYNASVNHEIDLPEIPVWLRSLRLNHTTGFFWKPEGFFDVSGEELRVPHSETKVIAA